MRNALVILSFVSIALGAPAAVERIAGADKAVHALNRLAYGPRRVDVDAVKQIGLDQWIERQLHPEAIRENPVLEAKLAPL
jgi:hypothetical protein